jgi:rhodanese-related sulfurtransferase
MAKYLYIVFPMIAALFAVSAVQARSPAEVEGATTVDESTAKALFDRDVPFVDVRNAGFYYDGHIPRAVNLHWVGKFTEAALGEVATKDQEVVIYAWHYKDGPWYERSSETCKRAVSWGFKKVYYFRAGFPGWKAAGYPSE